MHVLVVAPVLRDAPDGAEGARIMRQGQRAEDGPAMHASEEAFDDSERDKASDVDGKRSDVVRFHPGSDGKTWAERGIESEEIEPRRNLLVVAGLD